jgi:RNA polymerase sigma-70 factor (ECF subfamily)
MDTHNETRPEPRIAAPDADLVRRIRADDLDAFEAFFQRYRNVIYRTAYGMTGDPGAAEEILQDTFVRAYRHRATLREDVSPLPWLHRVALNLCYSRLGRRRLHTGPIGEAEVATLRDLGAEPAELAERQELAHAVRAGIACLSPKHQSVIVLYYLDGLSLQETATALGIHLGTVKSRLHYALGALRVHLARESRAGEAAGQALPGAATAEGEARPR